MMLHLPSWSYTSRFCAAGRAGAAFPRGLSCGSDDSVGDGAIASNAAFAATLAATRDGRARGEPPPATVPATAGGGGGAAAAGGGGGRSPSSSALHRARSASSRASKSLCLSRRPARAAARVRAADAAEGDGDVRTSSAECRRRPADPVVASRLFVSV